jgi:hypothetical protein
MSIFVADISIAGSRYTESGERFWAIMGWPRNKKTGISKAIFTSL